MRKSIHPPDALHVLLTSQDPPPASEMTAALGAGALVWQVQRLPSHIDQIIRPDALPAPVALVAEGDGQLLWAMRERWPTLQVVISGHQPAEESLDLMLAWRARGWVRAGSSAAEHARALWAVAAGQVWAPRDLLARLFERSVIEPLSDAPPLRESQTHRLAPPAAVTAVDAKLHASAAPHWRYPLTERERATMLLVRRGLTNKEIAQELCISLGTVKKHVASAFCKLGLQRRRQLMG